MTIYVMTDSKGTFKDAFRSISKVFDYLVSKNLKPLGIVGDIDGNKIVYATDGEHNYKAYIKEVRV